MPPPPLATPTPTDPAGTWIILLILAATAATIINGLYDENRGLSAPEPDPENPDEKPVDTHP